MPDILGGFFAVNGGAFGGKVGNVFYYAPDSGEWEDTQLGYSQFLYWALSGDISKFYELYRWDGWREDVRNFSLDNAVFDLDTAYLNRRKKLILHEISIKFLVILGYLFKFLDLQEFISCDLESSSKF